MKFGFIGIGNMGGALARAVSKALPSGSVYVADRDIAKAERLANDIGAAVKTNIQLVNESDYIILGVKPQAIDAILQEIGPVLKDRKNRFVLISMAAGVKIEKILGHLGQNYPVIRIMPNTPAAVGQGMILYSESSLITKEDTEIFLKGFSKAGCLDELNENMIDAACAVSGCGPAFVYLFAEALADGAVACGLPRDKALLYASQMIKGSAELMLESGQHPGKLKDDVCSPGGSTIVGVKSLENAGFRAATMNAVCDAFEKTVELGK